ncbi:MAG: GAF domain-containing protein [Anaerolineae bacterium]|nr:GAF domain-containing protein [Anaerolineae bacterium]
MAQARDSIESGAGASLLAGEGWIGALLRALVGAAGLALVQAVHHGSVPEGAAWSVGLYLAFALLLACLQKAARALPAGCPPWGEDLARTLVLLGCFGDLAFVSLLVFHSGGPLSDACFLYGLLMLRVAVLYGPLPEVVSVAGLVGPAYAGVLYVHAGGWFFLVEPAFLWRYLMLFALSVGSIVLGKVIARNQRRVEELEARLKSSRLDVARATLTLQQTAADLSRRVQQLRMLQEGAKAISSALGLEDLLALIVANAAQVVRDARCSLALQDEDTGALVIRAVSDLEDRVRAANLPLSEGFAAWVVQNRKPIRINHAADDPRLAGMSDWPLGSLISVPLLADGDALGALIATSPEAGAFTDEDLEALSAFAAQAVIAVKNARLYSRVQERRSELEAMLRGIGDGVIATDARLRLTVLNPIAARIFGVQHGVSAGQPLSEVIGNPDLVALFHEILASDHPSLIREISLPGPTAEPGTSSAANAPSGEHTVRFYQALASRVLGEGGEPKGVVVVLRDVTRQRELDQVKSDFLSVVTHELKTPLHSIKGFVDIILMGRTGPLTETQRDFLTTVKEQAEGLQMMINDLLEFSRLQAGQVRLRIERVLVGQVVQGVVARMAPLAHEANLELVNLVPGDFGLIQADEARLEQVITNLLSNALKFTTRGRVAISARDLGSEVQVSVSDTGIGIPADQLQRIFERFYQVDGTSTRSYRGAGLGLTICKHIVEYHGGRIWAESAEGEGSTFHFVLPKVQPAPDTLVLDFSAPPPGRS